MHKEFIKRLSDAISPLLLFYLIGSPLIMYHCPSKSGSSLSGQICILSSPGYFYVSLLPAHVSFILKLLTQSCQTFLISMIHERVSEVFTRVCAVKAAHMMVSVQATLQQQQIDQSGQ